ncbi:DUF4278 domain-containing protein [Leptolyngbya sp. NK1-12]|uniref:DUF4278 domain-containing protein n=1 Tax=Leptolyngbya sp. NK1-12 TaxID=2547451 RepID=A0AA96WAE8_9CYAN|nr:DUF4278 domain-containing protein [Leptolyngbya sp. NK1-12]
MQLCYRGSVYEYDPPQLVLVDGSLSGVYRGATWRSKQFRSELIPQSVRMLRYRGVMYARGNMLPTIVFPKVNKLKSCSE